MSPHRLAFLVGGTEGERLTRLGILRGLALCHLGVDHPVVAALAKAAADSTADILPLNLLEAAPALPRRRILANFAALTMPSRTRRRLPGPRLPIASPILMRECCRLSAIPMRSPTPRGSPLVRIAYFVPGLVMAARGSFTAAAKAIVPMFTCARSCECPCSETPTASSRECGSQPLS